MTALWAVLLTGLLGLVPVLATVGSHALAARALGLRPVFGVVTSTGAPSSKARRALVGVAGLLGGYAYCAVLVFVALALTGRAERTAELKVHPGLRAEQAGMETGDRVVRMAGETVRDFDHVRALALAHPEQPMEVEIVRGGEPRSLAITPDATGRIGVQVLLRYVPYTAAELATDSASMPARVMTAVVIALTRAVIGRETVLVAGPEMLVREASATGGGQGLLILAQLTSYFALWLLWPELVVLAVALLRGPSRDR